ncbi:hypothetical protein BD414DRAFT_254053 [Trametes punicea]|nr:hypothetical protein BD414DRAFT_254053 [Trametes punicea]
MLETSYVSLESFSMLWQRLSLSFPGFQRCSNSFGVPCSGLGQPQLSYVRYMLTPVEDADMISINIRGRRNRGCLPCLWTVWPRRPCRRLSRISRRVCRLSVVTLPRTAAGVLSAERWTTVCGRDCARPHACLTCISIKTRFETSISNGSGCDLVPSVLLTTNASLISWPSLHEHHF